MHESIFLDLCRNLEVATQSKLPKAACGKCQKKVAKSQEPGESDAADDGQTLTFKFRSQNNK